MSNLNCPFYENGCILKQQVELPEFKEKHDCHGLLNCCSFFAKEKIKQIKVQSPIKVIIKKVDNVYLVKADGLVYPTNNLLQIDDPLLNKMTNHQAQKKCDELLKHTIKMGYSYIFESNLNWHIKQKYFINAVVAGESRLVNEKDVSSAIKKTIIIADNMGLESLVMLPCDNGTHDISLASMSQLSSILTISQKHNFKALKYIYICMTDEESEEVLIEYYNRIFSETHKGQL